MNAGRAVERVDDKSGIVGKGRQAGRLRCGSALMRALSRKLVPVSSGSARPSSPADTTSMP